LAAEEEEEGEAFSAAMTSSASALAVAAAADVGDETSSTTWSSQLKMYSEARSKK
jgi:hypothetical protein